MGFQLYCEFAPVTFCGPSAAVMRSAQVPVARQFLENKDGVGMYRVSTSGHGRNGGTTRESQLQPGSGRANPVTRGIFVLTRNQPSTNGHEVGPAAGTQPPAGRIAGTAGYRRAFPGRLIYCSALIGWKLSHRPGTQTNASDVVSPASHAVQYQD